MIGRARDGWAEFGRAWLIVELLLGTVIAVSVLSLVAYALANWGYRLTRRDDATLHVRRGLLTSRAVTIEEARLRGVVVEQPLFLRVPRGARAKALVTGGGQMCIRDRGQMVARPDEVRQEPADQAEPGADEPGP